MARPPRFDDYHPHPPRRPNGTRHVKDGLPDEPSSRKLNCKATEQKDAKIFKIIMFWFFFAIIGVGIASYAGFFRQIEIGDRYFIIEDSGWERGEKISFGITVTDVNYEQKRLRYVYIGTKSAERELTFEALKRSYVAERDLKHTTSEKTK